MSARYYVKETWGCIVGHGIPGTTSSYVTVDGSYLGARRAFTEAEARAYIAEHRDPSSGVYLTVEVVW